MVGVSLVGLEEPDTLKDDVELFRMGRDRVDTSVQLEV